MKTSELPSWKIALITFVVVIISSFLRAIAFQEKEPQKYTPREDGLVITNTYYKKYSGKKFAHFILVNPKTGVMYIEICNTITELYDTEGKPIIYSDNLDEIKSTYK